MNMFRSSSLRSYLRIEDNIEGDRKPLSLAGHPGSRISLIENAAFGMRTDCLYPGSQSFSRRPVKMAGNNKELFYAETDIRHMNKGKYDRGLVYKQCFDVHKEAQRRNSLKKHEFRKYMLSRKVGIVPTFHDRSALVIAKVRNLRSKYPCLWQSRSHVVTLSARLPRLK